MLLSVLLALAAAAPAPLVASAAAPPARTTLNDVEDELMCDTCNVPLNIAVSPRADQERAEIRRLIAEGKTKQEILDTFAAEYGPNILADPRGGGTAAASRIVPAAILLGALIAIALALRRWRRRRGLAAGGAAGSLAAGAQRRELAPADAARLERDLALYD